MTFPQTFQSPKIALETRLYAAPAETNDPKQQTSSAEEEGKGDPVAEKRLKRGRNESVRVTGSFWKRYAESLSRYEVDGVSRRAKAGREGKTVRG